MKILKNNGLPIYLNRGDTGSFEILLNDGDDFEPLPHIMSDDEILYIGITEPNQPFEKALIKKVLKNDMLELTENDTYMLTLNPEDTEYVREGVYYIEVKLHNSSTNIVKTYIDKTLFYIV